MTAMTAVQKWYNAGYCNDPQIARGVGRQADLPDVVTPGYYCYPAYGCPSCRDDKNGKGTAVLFAVALAFSAIVAFFASMQAARNALDHNDDYNKEMTRRDMDAAIIYQGMRNEQAAASVCRLMLAVGFAILIASAVIYCYQDASPLFNQTLAIGCGITGFGLLSYGLKYVAFRYRAEHEAARRILGLASDEGQPARAHAHAH